MSRAVDTSHVVGPTRPRRIKPDALPGIYGYPPDGEVTDMLGAVNRAAHELQARLVLAHQTYRKAMRKKKGTNGRDKQLRVVLLELEAVNEEARRMHVHDEVMQPIFVELLAALRNRKL